MKTQGEDSCLQAKEGDLDQSLLSQPLGGTKPAGILFLDRAVTENIADVPTPYLWHFVMAALASKYATITNYHKYSSLKQNNTYLLPHISVEVWYGHPPAQVKVSVGLHGFLESLGGICFLVPSSCWQNSVPHDCRIKVPVPSLSAERPLARRLMPSPFPLQHQPWQAESSHDLKLCSISIPCLVFFFFFLILPFFLFHL